MSQLPYQVTLYDGTPPHENTPTSLAAAQSVKVSSNKQRARILEMFVDQALGYQGIVGWTDDEIEQETGLRHQSASARRRELVLLGKVKDSGRQRRTRSGRHATVWVLA